MATLLQHGLFMPSFIFVYAASTQLRVLLLYYTLLQRSLIHSHRLFVYKQ